MDNPTSVVVVDADNGLLTAAALSAEGYRCDSAASAEAALESVSGTAFDVMLADIAVPGVEEADLIRRAKRLRPEMAIIVMVGRIEDFSYESAVESGASDFIIRPFGTEELVLRLKHVVRQETLRVLSVTDELTRLSNRRGFFTLAAQQLKLSKRQHRAIYMLYADVNGLKGINDTWGHREGDAALIETADILRGTYRESDIVARIGGDEFVVIPIGSAGDNIPIIVGRLKQELEERNAKRRSGYQLSLSVGVACYDPANPCTIDELLSQGDRLMYEEKKLRGTS
jgi:two-component system cell cycle response regulator